MEYSVKDLIAGCVSGAAGVICGQPLDTIRVRLQSGLTSSFGYALRQTITQEGPLALFKGMAAPLAGFSFQNSAVFFAYGSAKRWLQGSDTKQRSTLYVSSIAAGAIAGAAQAMIVTPIELVKIRLQLRTEPMSLKRPGPLASLRQAWTQNKLRGVYKGLSATLARDIPGYATYFGVYEILKDVFGGPNPSPQVVFLAGGLAGILGWFVCYPTDVVKTKIQADDIASPRYRSLLHGFVACYKESGLKLFTRGLGATLARAFIVDGAIFLTFEFTHKLMSRYPIY